VLDALSDKWVTLILTALADSPRRYSELSRTIAGVSQKMLTQTLRLLERDGLVTRTITPAVPVRVDYQLTALGRTLLPVVRAIKDWSERTLPRFTPPAPRTTRPSAETVTPGPVRLIRDYLPNGPAACPDPSPAAHWSAQDRRHRPDRGSTPVKCGDV
jgi:DNA-binding HxlR family transcriptional regulator